MTIFHKFTLAIAVILSVWLPISAEHYSGTEILDHFDVSTCEGQTLTQTSNAIEISGFNGDITLTSNTAYSYIKKISLEAMAVGSTRSYLLSYELLDPETHETLNSYEPRNSILSSWLNFQWELYNENGAIRLTFRKGADATLKITNINIECESEYTIWFDETEYHMVNGEELSLPVPNGADGREVNYTSSNPAVVSIDDNQWHMKAHKPGSATITANVAANYQHPAGSVSFEVIVTNEPITGSAVSLELPQAGALREMMIDLPNEKIGSLTLSGPLNSDDIVVIRGGNARLSELQRLEISQCTLEADGGAYNSLQTGRSDIGMGTETTTWYLSDEERDEEDSNLTGLGGSARRIYRYTMDLGGAFTEMKSLKELILPKGITHIGDHIAWGCENLYYVEAPENVTVVEDGAFFECKNLVETSFKNLTKVGSSAFKGTAISDIDLSEATQVGAYAFGETYLSEANLSKIVEISDYAFRDSRNLSQVKLASNLKSIGNNAFDGTAISGKFALPIGVKKIGDNAFAGTGITEINEPTELLYAGTSILGATPWWDERMDREILYFGKAAIKYNPEYTQNGVVTVEEGTVSLASWLFNNTYIPKYDIVLPSSLKTIGRYCIHGNIGKITLPEGITYFDASAIQNGEVDKIVLSKDVECLEAYALGCTTPELYYDVMIDHNCSFNGLEKATVGPNAYIVRGIRGDNLLRVTFEKRPDLKPMHVAEEAFMSVPRVKSIMLPEGTKSIGYGAFLYCEALEEVAIPSTVEDFGMNIFAGCHNLKRIYNYMTTPVELVNGRYVPSTPFYSSERAMNEPSRSSTDDPVFPEGAVVYVLPQCVETYKADPFWSQWTIEEMDEEHLGAIDDVIADDIDPNKPVEYFNLQGQRVIGDSINPGIYILRQGNKTAKILVK